MTHEDPDVPHTSAEEVKALAGDRFMRRVVFTKKKMSTQTLEALVQQSTTVGPICSNPGEHARQKSDDTRRPDSSPSAWTCARDAFAHKDMNNTETVALIRDGHAFGKKQEACHESEPFPADRPLTLSQELEERPVTEHVEVIQEVAWNEAQQVRKQTISSPSSSLLGGLTRCDHEHRQGSGDRGREVIHHIPEVNAQFVEKQVNMHRRRPQWWQRQRRQPGVRIP